MFKKIADKIPYPEWIRRCQRFRDLDLRDRLLDGQFYDHLLNSFYDETDHQDRPIPLEDRRPSSQFRLPRMVARWCSRKLFAGRHKPRVRHPDKKLAETVEGIAMRCAFWQRMSEAVVRGSVGSCAATFRIEEADGAEPEVAVRIWHAKYCDPSFDAMGNLSNLRVQYLTTFAYFLSMGYEPRLGEQDWRPSDKVWFIRDYSPNDEVTYAPVREVEWNPVDGFTIEPQRRLEEFEKFTHAFGFVPGHWFVNLPDNGGDAAGGCTFEDAIPNSIELDYTLSQVGRGVRYNCAPQLVVVGKILNPEGDVSRSPMRYLHIEGGTRTEEGHVISPGSASLLEMSGEGTRASLELIESLRNLALEQIAASRKDPEKVKGPMSGRAMEYLDEDSTDLIMDLRSQYGEYGALPLLKKICLATKKATPATVGALTLQWPRIFQPTPDELLAIINGLMQATGLATAGKPAAMPKAAGATAGGGGAPAAPPKPVPPSPDMQLLSTPEAQAYLRMVMDLDMMDVDASDRNMRPHEAPVHRPGESAETDPAAAEPSADGGGSSAYHEASAARFADQMTKTS